MYMQQQRLYLEPWLHVLVTRTAGRGGIALWGLIGPYMDRKGYCRSFRHIMLRVMDKAPLRHGQGVTEKGVSTSRR